MECRAARGWGYDAKERAVVHKSETKREASPFPSSSLSLSHYEVSRTGLHITLDKIN